MSNLSLDSLKSLDGLIAAALVDSSSGMMYNSLVVGNFAIEVAAAANTEVVQAKQRAMSAAGLNDEHIEDILITLDSQYHLIRPLAKQRDVFIYIALDRARANLALARLELRKADTLISL